jgi:hypothetical protein
VNAERYAVGKFAGGHSSGKYQGRREVRALQPIADRGGEV